MKTYEIQIRSGGRWQKAGSLKAPSAKDALMSAQFVARSHPAYRGEKIRVVPVKKAARKPRKRRNPEERQSNPDVDYIVSRGQRYQRALENYVEAVRSGRGLTAARREMKAARKQFEDSLGPGVPISVIASAFGAGVGALGFGPVGAVIGALAAGAAPSIIEGVPDKSKAEEKAEELEAREGPSLLRAQRPQFLAANPKRNRYKRLMR